MFIARVNLLSRLLGSAGALLGAELLLGWLARSEAMVRILPSSNAVTFNTAIFLLLAGSVVAAGEGQLATRLRRMVGTLLIAGACLILFENMVDIPLGIDWENLHKSVFDGSARPGRIAPNACFAFLLIGISFLVIDNPPTTFRRTLVAACGIGEILLISTGVMGLLLDPTLLFGWYTFNRMAAPTALGLSLIALSVFLRHRLACRDMYLLPRQRERTILLTGAILLLGMGMAGSMTTFIIFANSQQHAIESRLLSEVMGQVRVADILLTAASAETRSLAATPSLRALTIEVAAMQNPAQQKQLRRTLETLLPTGFSHISLQSTNGLNQLSVGSAFNGEGLTLPLKRPLGDMLAWSSDGFVYRATALIRNEDGAAVAKLTIERRLPALDSIYHPVTTSASSAEIVICGYLDEGIGCFPSRLHPSPLLLPPRAKRRQLPVDEALAGTTKSRVGNDYRGKATVAAYELIGDTGLALLSKVDAVQIYAPINALLIKTLAVLAVALTVGTVLLRNLIGPLVKEIVTSQSDALKVSRRLKAITDNIPVLIGFLDKNLVYRFVNKTYEAWFDVAPDQVLGRTPEQLLSAEHLALAQPYFDRVLAGETVSFSMVKTSAHKPTYPKYVRISYIPDRDEHGEISGFNVLAFDETERRDQEAALAHLAHHDSLTQLPNRRLFEDRLQHALQLATRHHRLTALLYLDIDLFKQINDQHGHECGDILLRQFSQRLCDAVRASDTVARLGGDEFVVLMENLQNEDDAGIVASKILMAIRLPFTINTLKVAVTTSIGISFANNCNLSVSEFLSLSDQALYRAKQLGRDRYVSGDDSSES